MNRNKLFSDAELCMAASRLNEAMLGALPSPKECEHTFSAVFLANMDELLKFEHRKRVAKTWRRRVAAVLLAFLIGSGVFLAVNTEARAAVSDWIRQVWEKYVVYQFRREQKTAAMPSYVLNWIPDGFELVEKDKEDCSELIYYENPETGEIIIFQCAVMDEGTSIELYATAGELTETAFSVQGHTAYYYSDASSLSTLIWLDEDRHFVFSIDSNLPLSVVIDISAHINATDDVPENVS